MLDLAYKYENEIKEKFMNTWYDEKYKFYHASSYHSTYECPQDDWHSRHFVSLDDNRNVIGLISYEIDRVYEIANNFGAINFTNNKILFGRDLIQIIDDIFCKFNIRKMEFSCIVGNPIERSYDRMIKKFGGSAVKAMSGWQGFSIEIMESDVHIVQADALLKVKMIYKRSIQHWQKNGIMKKTTD